MDATSQGFTQLLEKYVYPFLTGSGLTLFFTFLINRQRQQSEAHLLDATELEKRVVITAHVIDIYKDGTEDAAEQIRGMRRELRTLQKKHARLEQDNEILRGMKGLPPAPNEKEMK